MCSDKVCYFYQNSWCRYGDHCHFLHIKPDSCINDADQYFSNEASGYSNIAAQTPCWYVLSHSKCPNGRHCPYSHDLARSINEYQQPSQSFVNISNKPWSNKKYNTSNQCVFYARGHCNRGSQCYFRHDKDIKIDETSKQADLNDFVVNRSNKTHSQKQYKPNYRQSKFSQKPANTVSSHEDMENEMSSLNLSESQFKTLKSDAMEKTTNGLLLSDPTSTYQSCGANTGKSTYTSTDAQCHENKSEELSKSIIDNCTEPQSDNTNYRAPTSRQTDHNTINLCDLTEEDIKRLNEMERSLLKKKFGKDKLKSQIINEIEHFRILFSSTSPDWPYDVKEIALIVMFPATYPKKACSVHVEASEYLPKVLLEHLNDSIESWISKKQENMLNSGRLEIYFRQFLRWLDRNLEELFTQGLVKYKAIISNHLSNGQEDNCDNDDDSLSDMSEEEESEYDDDEDEDTNSESDNEEADVSKSDKKLSAVNSSLLNPVRKGTEIYMKNLQLLEQAETAWFSQLKVLLRCQRCKMNFDWLFRECSRPITTQCAQCNNDQGMHFRPALLHSFTFVLGFLDLIGCSLIDVILVDCKAVIHCSNCLKDHTATNFVVGSLNNFRCFNCHQKLALSFDGMRYTQIGTEDEINLSQAVKVVVKKPKKSRDQIFQEGQPMPNNGACKHYKHSYRWLRFPCCGKAFPCDVCHDDAALDGHEMVFANRMICGFCSKEQPFAQDRPCVACHKNMTKSASKFWEGGKGCRNKSLMSRSDVKKYANMSKTVSRKSTAKRKK